MDLKKIQFRRATLEEVNATRGTATDAEGGRLYYTVSSESDINSVKCEANIALTINVTGVPDSEPPDSKDPFAFKIKITIRGTAIYAGTLSDIGESNDVLNADAFRLATCQFLFPIAAFELRRVAESLGFAKVELNMDSRALTITEKKRVTKLSKSQVTTVKRTRIVAKPKAKKA